MLRDLGLEGSGSDDAVYRFLIAHAAATESDLARALAIPATVVTRAVSQLRDLGLIVVEPAVPASTSSPTEHRWRAVAPELAIGPMVARSRDRLRRAEDAFLELVDAYRREHTASAASDLVEFVEGRAAQAAWISRLESGARRSIDVFQTGRNLVVPVAESIYEDPPEPEPEPEGARGASAGFDPLAEPATAHHDGVRYRVVVDTDFLTEPAAIRALDERLALGHEVRIVDDPLAKLVIVDGELGMIQVSGSASVVLRAPLVVLGTQLFETTWRHARPYFSDGTQISTEDRRVLQLMLAGLTDAAAASQLGTSPRTIQRRLRALMNRAQVTSRVQLGWHAMRNNWI
ncbi:LuxR C-terminal-related transcriptional regulator [Microbacterium jejuense]|uniref:LuxR C-terminal-related transcriptional regulator n=1 Tax=Microbacterium jejuense TaxID=1263637 RepID=UPI0031EB7936